MILPAFILLLCCSSWARILNPCNPGSFKCSGDLSCISQGAVCDGWSDCPDGSDEDIITCGSLIRLKRRSTAKVCNQAKSPANGQVSYPDCLKSEYEFAPICIGNSNLGKVSDGWEAQFKCKSGFTLQGSSTIKCNVGVWSDDEPTCVKDDSGPKSCTLPTKPPNGEMEVQGCTPDSYHPSCLMVKGSVLPPNSMIIFSCNNGYSLQGSRIATCLNGKWTPNIPSCVIAEAPPTNAPPTKAPPTNAPSNCPKLQLNPNVRAKCSLSNNAEVDCNQELPHRSKVVLECDPYYVPNTGLSRMTCQNGRWTHSSFFCTAECGVADVTREAFIVHGVPTMRGQWPWHAAIYQLRKSEWTYICGGSLIKENIVITAAHCVTQPSTTAIVDDTTLKVVLGKYSSNYSEKEEGTQESNIQTILVHSTYDPNLFSSDIALLVLEIPVTYSYYVRPVCYPENSEIDEQLFFSSNVGWVAGWGIDENNQVSKELRKASLQTAFGYKCREKGYPVSDSTFCAGNTNGTNVCNGDSGGGMVFPYGRGLDTKWYLVGVVSFGVRKRGSPHCDPTHYSLFTRVGKFSDWLGWTIIEL